MSDSRPTKQNLKDSLTGLARSVVRKRVHTGPGAGALDLPSTLHAFGFSTGFDTQKYIEEFYSHHPISTAIEQRKELRTRRELVSEALKSYVTNHYQSFINTSSEVTTIENDMLKLNHLLGQFQVGLKVLSGSINFSYEDERLGAKMKAIEKANGTSTGGGLFGSSSGSSSSTFEYELEELNEELRGWIYERKFEKALSSMELIQEKLRKRVKELRLKREQDGERAAAAGDDAFGQEDSSNNVTSTASFKTITGDFFYLRHTLIEMLFSELRACATSSSMVIGGKIGSSSASAAASSKKNSSGDTPSTIQLQSLIGYLISLKQSKKTLQVFLYQVKSTHLKSSIKAIKFTGDILGYIQELSQKFFQGLATTCIEFQRLFLQQTGWEKGGSTGDASGGSSGSGGLIPNPASLSSYLIRWLLHELLNTYNTIFQKQVFQSEGTFSKLGKCLKYAFGYCQQLETRSTTARGSGGFGLGGLNLSFVLARMFLPSLIDVISKNYKHVENLIHEELNVENWRVVELWVQDISKEKEGAAQDKAQRRKHSTASSPTNATVPVKKKRALRLTSSAKYLYDIVRNLLRELVPILDTGSSSSSSSNGASAAAGGHYPELRLELYPVIIQGIISIFESYLLVMAQKLKGGLADNSASSSASSSGGLEEIQCLSMIANSYYLYTDLLPRVIKEFKKQFCTSTSSSSSSGGGIGGPATLPELELFHLKLRRLYEALRDNFLQKRAQFIWPFDAHLKFTTKLFGGMNKYANPMGIMTSGELVQVTPEWVEFTENYLPVIYKSNLNKCLPKDEVELILTQSLAEFVEGLEEGTFKTAAAINTQSNPNTPTPISPAASFWATYTFGLGGLQQFLLDLKFFALSCGSTLTERVDEIQAGGYISSKAASSITALLSSAITNYCRKTSTKLDEKWLDANVKWLDDVLRKRVIKNAKNINNLARIWQLEKDKVTYKQEKQERDELLRATSPLNQPASSSSSATSKPGSSAATSSSTVPHGSSSIALPQRGVRRGSTITPEQLALMAAAMPISSLEDGNSNGNGSANHTDSDEDEEDDGGDIELEEEEGLP